MYADTLNSLFAYIETVPDLPTLYYPNREELPPSETHLRLDVIPMRPESITYDSTMEKGIFQVSIYTGQDIGPLAAARIADKILTAFPRNFSIDKVKFTHKGSISGAFYDDPWYVTPVSLYFYVIT